MRDNSLWHNHAYAPIPIRRWSEFEQWERDILLAVFGEPVDEYAEGEPDDTAE